MYADAYFYGTGNVENRLKKLENPSPIFQMYVSTNESISPGSQRRMGDPTYWTIDKDQYGTWDETNLEFVLPEDGMYAINWRERMGLPSIPSQKTAHFVLVNNPDDTGHYAYMERFNLNGQDSGYTRETTILTDPLTKGSKIVFLNENKETSTDLVIIQNNDSKVIDGKTYKWRGNLITIMKVHNN